MLLLSLSLQLSELLGTGIALGVKGFEGLEGRGGERPGKISTNTPYVNQLSLNKCLQLFIVTTVVAHVDMKKFNRGTGLWWGE